MQIFIRQHTKILINIYIYTYIFVSIEYDDIDNPYDGVNTGVFAITDIFLGERLEKFVGRIRYHGTVTDFYGSRRDAMISYVDGSAALYIPLFVYSVYYKMLITLLKQ